MFWNKKETRIRTIHIYEKWSQKKRESFVKDLYRKILYKDPSFHFFYEPEIIIRTRNQRTVGYLKRYFDYKHILYAIYKYPDKNAPPTFYGDPAKSITVKYLSEFLQAYHALAVFQMTVKAKDLPEIRAKVIHSLYNMDYRSYEYEGRALNNLGMNRMYQIGQMEGMKYKEKSKKLNYLKSKNT